MVLAAGMTIIGLGVWRFLQSRETVQQRIVQGEQQLMENEFAGKQLHVRQLEKQLYDAQHETNQSVSVIEELQVSQHTALSQLEKYQNEIEETRRKIDAMQEELHDLRQHMPASPAEVSSEPKTIDCQELIQECEAFKIVTRDQAVLRLFQNLKKAAATQVPILILGETGTGKEVFAKAAHALSPRRQGPFISVNMAAIRSELFEGELFGHVKGAFTGAVGRMGFLESAHGGTLFLDEVGDLPLDLQAKLLRFLEDGGLHRVGQSSVTHVDARIIAATNRDLQQEVQSGRYREDLYYRLRGMVLTLPPLRMRSQADHVLLAQSFLQQCAHVQHRTDLAFTQGALDAIVAHQWPGNIRELRQTIAQAVALANGPMITEGDLNLGELTTSVIGENWVKEDLGQREDAMVLDCLRRHKFEMQATAANLGWDRGTVTQRLKGLGFQALMECQGNIHEAAHALAGDERFVRVVEGRLREYANNLVPPSKHYGSVEEAIADCRKRFRNLPERHFPAVERLIHARFASL
jgi:transcriptional regulator with PAS, ATPase and Fis domain